MPYENILVEKVEGGVGLIRLNRPKAMNALDSVLMSELVQALNEFEADREIGCIVITGSEKVFAAGADIKEMENATTVEMLTRDSISLWDKVAKINKPVIAAVSGVALGGGCELAMACDMIVASTSAKFGQPEINLGVIPGAGGTQRLTRAVGKALAMEMVLNNRWLEAQEAYQFGLVNRVVAPETYLDEALKLARDIAARAPVAVRLARESVNAAFELPLSEGIRLERRNFYFLFSTEDQKEGMNAFVNKRPAKWQGK
ncbi:MAG: enoyl-CoA hydratase [Chloroflexota bacterium]|nr:enoyl-CoA hydratase [Chloroflexota bacterium]NOG63070.1 enoyl-CoA hydratase [Chloroflexota bacterium]GIK62882.1 MAG: enoyl-CoA hydratase [Chloroflexota bacterium]